MKVPPAISLLRACAGLLLLAALPAAAANKSAPGRPAQSKPAPSKPTRVDDGFKDFAVIAQRNVFNANRSLTPTPAASKTKATPPPKIEAFALLGTMSLERGSVAFFDGTSATFRKAVETGDKLGTYTVAAIAHDRVTLKAGESELCLPLKMQFRREDQGEWQLAELPDDFQPTQPPPGHTLLARRPDSRGMSSDQVLDLVSNKYQRKLEQLANDPVKSEKLLKTLDREVESRIKKLDKLDRRMQ
ncbi:MAG: hypothetical protein ABMA26_05260 [Limisphaerales bacterium]